MHQEGLDSPLSGPADAPPPANSIYVPRYTPIYTGLPAAPTPVPQPIDAPAGPGDGRADGAPPPAPWAHGSYAPPAGEPGHRSGIDARAAGGIGAGILAFLAKFGASLKFILPALLKAPFLVSILINIVFYAFLYGSQMGIGFGLAYGTGIVALIFVHEMGHLIAARMTDTPTTNPLFIPMFGAVIGVRGYRNSTIEAINGIGGPVLGTLGAIAVYAWATLVGADSAWGVLLLRLAYIGFLINLFNMIPVTLGGGFTLDGGRVLQAVSKWAYVAGVGALALLVVSGLVNSPLLWIFLLLGAWGTYRRFHEPDHPEYNTTSIEAKAVILVAYFTLLAILVAGMVTTEQLFNAF